MWWNRSTRHGRSWRIIPETKSFAHRMKMERSSRLDRVSQLLPLLQLFDPQHQQQQKLQNEVLSRSLQTGQAQEQRANELHAAQMAEVERRRQMLPFEMTGAALGNAQTGGQVGLNPLVYQRMGLENDALKSRNDLGALFDKPAMETTQAMNKEQLRQAQFSNETAPQVLQAKLDESRAQTAAATAGAAERKAAAEAAKFEQLMRLAEAAKSQGLQLDNRALEGTGMFTKAPDPTAGIDAFMNALQAGKVNDVERLAIVDPNVGKFLAGVDPTFPGIAMHPNAEGMAKMRVHFGFGDEMDNAVARPFGTLWERIKQGASRVQNRGILQNMFNPIEAFNTLFQ